MTNTNRTANADDAPAFDPPRVDAMARPGDLPRWRVCDLTDEWHGCQDDDGTRTTPNGAVCS